MLVFPSYIKIFLLPIYYLFHKNIIFGLILKKIIKKFCYKDLEFLIITNFLSTSNYSSFFFKTYEYNDRKLIEKNINEQNKCVIVGGGIGFIPALAYYKSKNKIIVFEIDKRIKKNLLINLKKNKCHYNFYDKNLIFKKKNKTSFFYLDKNFLNNSIYRITSKKIEVTNIHYKKIKNFQKFNTLIIDAEGIEEYFIMNLQYLKNINHLFFELHYDLFNKEKISNLKNVLKKNKFKLIDQCFNSFYYKRSI